jgi:hypothetical protein
VNQTLVLFRQDFLVQKSYQYNQTGYCILNIFDLSLTVSFQRTPLETLPYNGYDPAPPARTIGKTIISSLKSQENLLAYPLLFA